MMPFTNLRGLFKLTCLRSCFSWALSSGSFGAGASFSAFFSSPSLAGFLALALAGFAAGCSLVDDLGVATPFAALGVDEVFSLILGFLTESERWGVCRPS
jgi:hypothetical protein